MRKKVQYTRLRMKKMTTMKSMKMKTMEMGWKMERLLNMKKKSTQTPTRMKSIQKIYLKVKKAITLSNSNKVRMLRRMSNNEFKLKKEKSFLNKNERDREL